MLMDDVDQRTSLEKCGIRDTLLALTQQPVRSENREGECQASDIQRQGGCHNHIENVDQDVPMQSSSITETESISNKKASEGQVSQSPANQGSASDLSSTEISLLPDLTSRRPFKPSSSKRQQLIGKEAVEIYLLRPKTKAGKLLRRGSMAHCKVRDMNVTHQP
jgi:hypothetical protein